MVALWWFHQFLGKLRKWKVFLGSETVSLLLVTAPHTHLEVTFHRDNNPGLVAGIDSSRQTISPPTSPRITER